MHVNNDVENEEILDLKQDIDMKVVTLRFMLMYTQLNGETDLLQERYDFADGNEFIL